MLQNRWAVAFVGMALVLSAMPGAQAAKVWTFDCGVQGWITTPNHTMQWSNAGGEGKVTLTYNELPEPFDPVFQCPGSQAIDLNATPYIIIDLETAGLPDPTPVGLFIFSTGDAEAWRVGGELPAGANRVVVDASTVDWGDPLWGTVQSPLDTEISHFRYDIPDGVGYDAAVGATVTVDYVAVAETSDFVPVQDTDLDCDGLTNDEEALYGTNPEMADTDGDGLSDYEEIAWDGDDTSYAPGVDLDPLNPDTDGDGYPDGMETRYGTIALDAYDYPPPMPAATNTGLWILIALMLGAVVFTLAVRKARNHS